MTGPVNLPPRLRPRLPSQSDRSATRAIRDRVTALGGPEDILRAPRLSYAKQRPLQEQAQKIPNFSSEAIVSVARGIYRAFGNDENYQILHHTANEALLSLTHRESLSYMRNAVSAYNSREPRSHLAYTDFGLDSCTMCGEGGFENARAFIRHAHRHIGVTFECEFCGKRVTARSDALRRHVKMFHLSGAAAFEKARKSRESPVF